MAQFQAGLAAMVADKDAALRATLR
jgi:hypothetical protein